MSDTQNSPESENAFAAPQAELIDTADDRPVLQLDANHQNNVYL